jgi:hypothetical protein
MGVLYVVQECHLVQGLGNRCLALLRFGILSCRRLDPLLLGFGPLQLRVALLPIHLQDGVAMPVEPWPARVYRLKCGYYCLVKRSQVGSTIVQYLLNVTAESTV